MSKPAGTAKAKGWNSEDWYQPGEGQLHFYPKRKTLAWVVGKTIMARAEAWGGEAPVPGVNYPKMKPRLTTPGTYVVYGHGPYVTKTWPMSRIPWGAALRPDPSGKYVLFQTGTGQWRRVDHEIREKPQLIASLIKDLYQDLYPDSRVHDQNGDGIPDFWVFNDFGPWAIRYFVDHNRNRKRDGGESLMGEMIHTTPDNEAQDASKVRVQMEPSHGCVHVRPSDRDKFLSVGALAVGNLFVVHGPSENVPEFLTDVTAP